MKREIWPKGFTAGEPKKPGCYVCAIRDGEYLDLALFYIEYVDVGFKTFLGGIRPGLVIIDNDRYIANVEDYGIESYLRIDDETTHFVGLE